MGGSGDNNWNDNNGNGAYGGSAFLSFNWDVSGSNWNIGARKCNYNFFSGQVSMM